MIAVMTRPTIFLKACFNKLFSLVYLLTHSTTTTTTKFTLRKAESESEVAQLCLTLSDPMDCSPPGSSIHGICQARVLEWVAIAF